MNGEELLKGRVEEHPRIYAYIHPTLKEHKGWIKVGYTTRDVQERIKEQHRTAGVAYKIVGQWAAMRQDGTTFTDKDVHRLLRKAGYRNPEGEWFRCTLDDVEHAVRSAQMGADIILQRTATFAMRDEQAEAVSKTADYLNRHPEMECRLSRNGKTRFLTTDTAKFFEKGASLFGMNDFSAESVTF